MLSSLLLSAYDIYLSSRLWFSLGATYLSFFWFEGGNKNTAGDDFSYPNLGTWIKKNSSFTRVDVLRIWRMYTSFYTNSSWNQCIIAHNFENLLVLLFFFFDSKMAVMIKAEWEVQETFVLEVWKPVCLVRWMAKSRDVILERWWK